MWASKHPRSKLELYWYLSGEVEEKYRYTEYKGTYWQHQTKHQPILTLATDYELALKAETWPYRVGVRVYRHFKQRREAEEGTSGQFGQRQGEGNMAGN